VRTDRNERKDSGVAIIINNKLKYLRKDGLYDGDGKIEVWPIELYTGQDKILIVLWYNQPHMKIELRVGKKFFAQFEDKFLIGGDINGHHHSWGNSKTALPATTCTIVSPNWKLRNITLLNDGSQTYISDATGSKAALDLILWTQDQHCYIPGRLEQTLGIATIIQFPSSITA
jgi:hypothetical protein